MITLSGLIVGPAIGGILSRPAVQYPSIFFQDTIWARYPYLLPCLVSASLAVVGFIFLFLYLPETLSVDTNVKEAQISDDTLNKRQGLSVWERIRSFGSGGGSDNDGPSYEMISASSSHGDRTERVKDDFSCHSLSTDDDVVSISLSPLSSSYDNSNIKELLNDWSHVSDDNEIFDERKDSFHTDSEMRPSNVSRDDFRKLISKVDEDEVIFENMESQSVADQVAGECQCRFGWCQ